MSRRKPKPGKIAIVVFLTVLIWVWADLALDETPPPRRARVVADRSKEDLWVSFGQAPHFDFELTLSGPHSAFNTLDRLLQKQEAGSRLDFVLDVSLEEMDDPGRHKLVLLDFLQKNEQLRRLGLKVKGCDPNSIEVDVIALEERPALPVECVDERGRPLSASTIDPGTIRMFVPESCRAATVQLSSREIDLARSKPISLRPFVMVTPGQKKSASDTVNIKLAEHESPLSEGMITNVKLHVSMSSDLVGEYKIEYINLPEIIGREIQIRATPAAKDRYQNMPYHVRLELDADDAKAEQPLEKVLIYNFPQDALRANEIELAQTPGEARFKLIRITPESP